MTSTLRIAKFILTSLPWLVACVPALAEGRADWQGYAWQRFDITKCQPLQSELACPPYHQKWDWKRNQWVDIVLAVDLGSGRVRLTQQLTNRDPSDDDDVCVTLLVLDADGRTIIAHHQNWHSLHGDVMQDDFALRSNLLASAASVHIGSKQCRQGPHQDDALYAAVIARLPR